MGNAEQSKKKCIETMTEVNEMIKKGSDTFLAKEYTYLAIFCVVFAIVLTTTVDQPWAEGSKSGWFPFTTFAFLVGAVTSMVSGFIGMKIATNCNYKVTAACADDKIKGFKIAFMGGQVLGFMLVGLALLILEILILCYRPAIVGKNGNASDVRLLFEYLSGYGLGGSTVALFGRVGGGIYTKAADVGADLAGKVTHGLEEDSPRNPGTIADNVGDNVGDIAGMGADLFGSLAESTCAALVVSATSYEMVKHTDAIYFPLVITATGVIVSFITQWFAKLDLKVDQKLFYQLVISTVLMSVFIIPAVYLLPHEVNMRFGGEDYSANRWELYSCIMMGLWSGMIIGGSTEYYTSNSYQPVKDLAQSCEY